MMGGQLTNLILAEVGKIKPPLTGGTLLQTGRRKGLRYQEAKTNVTQVNHLSDSA